MTESTGAAVGQRGWKGVAERAMPLARRVPVMRRIGAWRDAAVELQTVRQERDRLVAHYESRLFVMPATSTHRCPISTISSSGATRSSDPGGCRCLVSICTRTNSWLSSTSWRRSPPASTCPSIRRPAGATTGGTTGSATPTGSRSRASCGCGVRVHFHDVFYPFEYPRDWVFEGRAWNELYLLRALLSYSTRYRVALWPSMLATLHPDRLSAALPMAMPYGGGSL